MFLGRGLTHQVDFVLEDDDVIQLHDFDSSQVLRGLGLGTGFVPGNEEESSIHNRGARQHGAHENVVPRTIDETSPDVNLEPLVIELKLGGLTKHVVEARISHRIPPARSLDRPLCRF